MTTNHVPNDKSVCKFTLAVNRGGKEKDKADFIECVAWNAQAENLLKYQGKRSQLAVEGALYVDKYKDKEGKNRYKTYVQVKNTEFLNAKKGANNTDSDPQIEEFEGDLPF